MFLALHRWGGEGEGHPNDRGTHGHVVNVVVVDGCCGVGVEGGAGKVKLYVGYGAKVLAEGPMLEIRARGRAVPKAVSVAEALKRKIPGLHQVSTIESHNDHPAMIIVLSKDPPLGAPDLIGYQHSADNV